MGTQVESIKWVPGTPFIVDGFRFQSPACRAYFLTHAHSDHTTGLTASFSAGLLYCSPVTARVLGHDFPGLARRACLHILEPGVTVTICGVEVTPLDANHCPGAVMFLFRVPPPAGGGGKAQTILHTGDMRWHAGMAEHPALRGQQVDVLMLDTTYAAPRWDFPPQPDAVAALAALMAREAAAEPATLFAVGSYHIGKERAYLGAAATLGWRVHCTPAKRKLLGLLGLPPSWLALLTEAPEEAQVHVLGMGEQLQEQALAAYIAATRWTRVVAIKPTGWSHRRTGGLDLRTSGCVTLVGVPYSEHSSFTDLRDCVRALRPRRIVPTVNAGDAAKARALVDRFADLMDLSRDRSRLDAYLARPAARRQQPQHAAGAAGDECGGAEEEVGEQRQQQQQQSAAATPRGGGGSKVEPTCAPRGSDSCAAESSQADAAAGPQGQPSAQLQAEREQAEGSVDLSAIDLREQRRILEQIQSRSRASSSSRAASSSTPCSGVKKRAGGSSRGGSGGKQRAGAASQGSGGLRQPNLKRFFSPAAAEPFP